MMKRGTTWPLERAQLAIRHARALQAAQDRADEAVARAKAETARARQLALEELGRWHMEDKRLLEYIYDDIKRAIASGVGPAVACRIQDAWREMEPQERVQKQLRDAMLSRMETDVRAIDATTSYVRVRIPPVEFNYATDFAGFDGFPWRKGT